MLWRFRKDERIITYMIIILINLLYKSENIYYVTIENIISEVLFRMTLLVSKIMLCLGLDVAIKNDVKRKINLIPVSIPLFGSFQFFKDNETKFMMNFKVCDLRRCLL